MASSDACDDIIINKNKCVDKTYEETLKNLEIRIRQLEQCAQNKTEQTTEESKSEKNTDVTLTLKQHLRAQRYYDYFEQKLNEIPKLQKKCEEEDRLTEDIRNILWHEIAEFQINALWRQHICGYICNCTTCNQRLQQLKLILKNFIDEYTPGQTYKLIVCDTTIKNSELALNTIVPVHITVVDTTKKEVKPIIVETDKKEVKPIIVETDKKEVKPIIVETDKKEVKPIIVEDGNKCEKSDMADKITQIDEKEKIYRKMFGDIFHYFMEGHTLMDVMKTTK